MSRRIYQYPLLNGPGKCVLSLPFGAHVLTVQTHPVDQSRVGPAFGPHARQVVLWAEVDEPATHVVDYTFYLCFTGDEVPPVPVTYIATVPVTYIATVQTVLHIYQAK